MKDNRYHRQIILNEVGQTGQEKLLDAHIIIIGCGGLGSISAPYLAGAGIGEITLIDDDVVDISNLHRQVIYHAADVGKKKAEILRNHLVALNPSIEVVSIAKRLDKKNISALLAGADVVIEGTDDVYSKYLVNDYCHINNIPMIYGAIHQYEGYVSTFRNKNTASIHLRDVFPFPNLEVPTCSEVGVLGTTAGIIGLIQANESIKLLLDVEGVLDAVLLTYDVIGNNQFKLSLKKTHSGDMNHLFRNENYSMKKDKIQYEINYSEIIKNRGNYSLISILDDAVHIDIDDEVIQLELDEISIHDYEPISDKTIVFYCRSGKESYGLVALLKNENPAYKVLSLKGGIRDYKKY